jgi:biopolymer transport protein ExbD
MLVLLIIFMVTAPMMNNAGVEIDLPRSEAPPLDPADNDQIVLSIDKARHTFVGDNEIPLGELEQKLTLIASQNPDAPVFLRADGEVPYANVAWVLGVAKRAGMPRVGLVFEPGADALPPGSEPAPAGATP